MTIISQQKSIVNYEHISRIVYVPYEDANDPSIGLYLVFGVLSYCGASDEELANQAAKIFIDDGVDFVDGIVELGIYFCESEANSAMDTIINGLSENKPVVYMPERVYSLNEDGDLNAE